MTDVIETVARSFIKFTRSLSLRIRPRIIDQGHYQGSHNDDKLTSFLCDDDGDDDETRYLYRLSLLSYRFNQLIVKLFFWLDSKTISATQ